MKSGLILVLILYSRLAFSVHLAGGDLTYKYISKASNGDVTYSLTLNLYVDCMNGNQGSIASDSIALLNVFDAKTGALVGSLCKSVKRQNPIRIGSSGYSCLKSQPSVCIDLYVFKTNFVLPRRANGYIITFERCCRNGSIINLMNPDKIGATYWTEIKPESDIGKNSSPVFRLRPPFFLCINTPFNFDYSAVDEDGDSLSYELTAPYIGGTMDYPRPDYKGTNFGSPIFPLAGNRQVQWSSSYGLNNEIGGNPVLEVDKFSGRMTVTPNKAGLFVVGVKVKEFRKGVLIGETKREFQTYVSNCIFNVLSLFNVQKTSFSDSVVSFINQSTGATKYKWDFGDPSSITNFSELNSPTHIYKKPGTYKVTLVAFNSTCSDTFDLNVIINKCNSIPKFSVGNICKTDSATFINESINSTEYLWHFGDGQSSNAKSPRHQFKIAGNTTYYVSLRIKDKDGCSDSVTHPITIYDYPNSDFSSKQTGSIVELKAAEQGNLIYHWKYGSTDSATTINGGFTFKMTKSEQTQVCLKVSNTGTCVSQTCKNINIGIYNLTNPKGFMLYPNPSTGCFTIEFESSNTDNSIEIFNQIGQTIYNENFIPIKLDLMLTNSIYIVKITTSGNTTFQRLIVSKN